MLAVLADDRIIRRCERSHRRGRLGIDGANRNGDPVDARVVDLAILKPAAGAVPEVAVEHTDLAAVCVLADLHSVLDAELGVDRALGVKRLKLCKRILHLRLNAAVSKTVCRLDPDGRIGMIGIEEAIEHRIGQVVACKQPLVNTNAIGVVDAVPIGILRSKGAGSIQNILHRFGRIQTKFFKPVCTDPEDFRRAVTRLDMRQTVELSAEGRSFHCAAAVIGQHLISELRCIICVDIGQIRKHIILDHALELCGVDPHQVGQIVRCDGDVELLRILRKRRCPRILERDAKLILIGMRPNIVFKGLALLELNAVLQISDSSQRDRRVILAERIGGFRLGGSRRFLRRSVLLFALRRSLCRGFLVLGGSRYGACGAGSHRAYQHKAEQHCDELFHVLSSFILRTGRCVLERLQAHITSYRQKVNDCCLSRLDFSQPSGHKKKNFLQAVKESRYWSRAFYVIITL